MADTVLANLKQGSLVERAFEALRDSILSGGFKDGDRLPPQEVLAEQLGVSRTVIREAVNKLAVLGLVDIRQGSGTFVRAVPSCGVIIPKLEVLTTNKESMQELTETRYYLEQAIAGLAAKRADKKAIQQLREYVANMEACTDTRDTAEYARYDLAFHMALAEAARNSVLSHVLKVVRESMLRFMEDFTQIPGAPRVALKHHAAIVDAVTRHDVRGAKRCMEEHIRFVIETLRNQYEYELEL